MRLANEANGYGINLRTMAYQSMCDACGTSHEWKSRCVFGATPNWEHITSEKVFHWAEKFDASAQELKPKVLGRDLIQAGLRPGPEIGRLMKMAKELQYSNPTLTKEEILSQLPL